MPTRNVNLTEALDQFVASTIESGRYENASEVVRAGLRALQEREQAHAEYLAFLRNEAGTGFAELDHGDSIQGTPMDIMASVRAHVGKLAAR